MSTVKVSDLIKLSQSTKKSVVITSLNESLNESSFIAACEYYFISTGKSNEYEELLKAGPIAFQDGSMEIWITTTHKPENITASNIIDTKFGFVSIYRKFDDITNVIAKKADNIKRLVDSITESYPVNLKLFYYPESPSEDVIVITSLESLEPNKGNAKKVISTITEFADATNITLTLTPSDYKGSNVNRLIEFYSNFGFTFNYDSKYDEMMIRKPKSILTESAMVLLSVSNSNGNAWKDKESIQSEEYKSQWYKEYVNILNSSEYKKQRNEEVNGIFIAKKKKSSAVIGLAIIGQAIIG